MERTFGQTYVELQLNSPTLTPTGKHHLHCQKTSTIDHLAFPSIDNSQHLTSMVVDVKHDCEELEMF